MSTQKVRGKKVVYDFFKRGNVTKDIRVEENTKNVVVNIKGKGQDEYVG